MGAAVGGLHHARAAPRDDREALAAQSVGDLGAQPVDLVAALDPRAAEDRHRGPDRAQRLEALDELRHDSKDDPGVFAAELSHAPDVSERVAAALKLRLQSRHWMSTR